MLPEVQVAHRRTDEGVVAGTEVAKEIDMEAIVGDEVLELRWLLLWSPLVVF